MVCDDCGFESRSAQGLACHRRAKHPEASTTPNAAALEVTLSELERMGRVETIDAARVQTLRSLAEAVDTWSDDAQLWRQYREALSEVLCADDVDSDLDRALAEIRSAAPVGDTPTS